MIIIEDEVPHMKAAQARVARDEEGMSEDTQLIPGPPPSYSAPTSYGASYNVPLQYPDDVAVYIHHERPVRTGSACRRLSKAFAAALGTWLLFAMLIQSFAEIDANLAFNLKWQKDRKPNDTSSPPDGKSAASDGRIRLPSCVTSLQGSPSVDNSSSGALHTVQLGFSLPVASDFVFSMNDSIAFGSFLVDTVESASSEVEVDVVISYRTLEALQRSKVCLSEQGAEHIIRVMSNADARETALDTNFLQYDIYVRLPVPSYKQRPLYVSRFAADFSSFAIRIGDLMGHVEFGEFDARTKYGAIESVSLSAHKARLWTSQASIRGNYTTSSFLELMTENAPIEADVRMLSLASDQRATHLDMHTKNGSISARLNLSNPSTVLPSSTDSPFSSKQVSIGGNFSISSATSDAASVLNVLSQPYSSFLSLSARTSNAPAEVSLPPQFSGAFSVETSVFRPALHVSSVPELEGGPGKGRHRDVEVTQDDKRLLEGNIIWLNKWGRVEEGGGQVNVKTSVLTATLKL